MKVQIQEKFDCKQAFEYVMIPYIEHIGYQMYLEELFPDVSFFFMESKENKTSYFYKNETKVCRVDFLSIPQTEETFFCDCKEFFSEFAKQLTVSCQIVLSAIEPKEQTEGKYIVRLIIQSMIEGSYRFGFEQLKEIGSNLFQERERLTEEKEEITITIITKQKEAVNDGSIYGHTINLARTISNLPNNYLHIKDFIKYAREMAKEYKFQFELITQNQLEHLHAGGILAVNKGSKEDAALILVTYKQEGAADNIAIVGKGVLFDTGGYHLKSIDSMQGMKYDMCGASNVLAVMEIAYRLNYNINITGIIPIVENVISPDAAKMGDVITMMSGKTVEIYNTDAEGRLILADALTYACRYYKGKENTTKILDMATLTYSCQAALGDQITGIFSNSEEFYNDFIQSSNLCGEEYWRMPLKKVYHKLIKNTNMADFINYAPHQGAGASVAACFLEEFIQPTIPWIHLDMVGTSVCQKETKSKTKGATGEGISSVAAYLERKGKTLLTPTS